MPTLIYLEEIQRFCLDVLDPSKYFTKFELSLSNQFQKYDVFYFTFVIFLYFQIISPHDKGISDCIMQNLEPRESSWNTTIISSHKLLRDPLPSVLEAYLKRRTDSVYDLAMNEDSEFSFTYTAMHGVGYKYIEKVFEALKLKVTIKYQFQLEIS